jgi:16S rRNA (uracil1498-N3)-methyltransferase
MLDIFGKPLFYAPEALSGQVLLSEEESRHCALSLRGKEGDVIFLTDGKGTIARAQLTKIHPKSSMVLVLETEAVDKFPIFRRLVVSPPKTGDRLDWMIEKVVEIGVDEIVLIQSRYSERDKVNLERLQKIAVSAMKQSKQAFLPQIIGVQKWKQFIEKPVDGDKFIATIDSSVPSRRLLDVTKQSSGSSFTILIGPEGDFSEEEVKQALEKGFVPVSLGKNILRTETASLYSIVCFNSSREA